MYYVRTTLRSRIPIEKRENWKLNDERTFSVEIFLIKISSIIPSSLIEKYRAVNSIQTMVQSTNSLMSANFLEIFIFNFFKTL